MSVVEFSADAWQASSPGLQKGLANRITAVSDLLQGLEGLAGSGNITGEGADGMRAYIGEVHVPILQCLLVSLSTFQTAIGVYWNGYAQVDTGGNFRLVKDELTTHLTRLESGMAQLGGFGTQLRGIAADASHLVSLGGAGASAVEQTVTELQGMHAIAKNQAETWEAYEASDPGFAQVKTLTAELGRIVNNVGTLTVGRGRTYTAGSFTLTLQRLGELTAGMVEYCQQNQKAATAGWEGMFSGYVKDLDQKRREQAGWDLIWDGLQIVAGAVVTAIGLGLTPFTGGASLGLTLIGGALLVGGINNAINHVSIATTGNEFNLAGMAGQALGQWYDVNVAQPAAESGSWGAQFLAGVGSGVVDAVSAVGQLNVHEIGQALTTLVTDQAARDTLWRQMTTTAGQVAAGNPFVIGELTGEFASLLIPGGAAVKAARAAGLLKKAGGLPDIKPITISTPGNATSAMDWLKDLIGAGKPVVSKKFTSTAKPLEEIEAPAAKPHGVDKTTRQVQNLTNELKDAVRRRAMPGYDPTGGLGWEGFMDEYLKGFDAEGRPDWRWPDDPPHTDGFMDGISKPSDLVPGDTLERITFRDAAGEPVNGKFAAPPGTTFKQLSLPPDRLGGNTTLVRYEILKPLPSNVQMGEIAPGLGQPGFGTQYRFPDGIEELVNQGYLKEIP